MTAPHPSRWRATPSPARGEGEKDQIADVAPSPFAGEGGRAIARPDEGQSLRAKRLRKEMTPAERKLWFALRDRRFANFKFRRQVPIGRYIVDFVSFECRVIVEVDGSQHSESAYDAKRDAWLTSQGFIVLRLWNLNVLTNLGGALDALAETIKTRPSPGAARRPLPQGERGSTSYSLDRSK